MAHSNDPTLQYTLEQLIDQHGLDKVLHDIAYTCYAKADHVATNWQDHTLAHTWEYVSNMVSRAAEHAGKASL